jgi:hypothetical protein
MKNRKLSKVTCKTTLKATVARISRVASQMNQRMEVVPSKTERLVVDQLNQNLMLLKVEGRTHSSYN